MKMVYKLRHFLSEKGSVCMNGIACQDGDPLTRNPLLDIFCDFFGNELSCVWGLQASLSQAGLNGVRQNSHVW